MPRLRRYACGHHWRWLSDLPPEIQEYMEDYIPKFLPPRHRVVYHWFDVYDLEEQRL
ncbi:MAG TPA: hypothetical protein VNT99_00590 [Methylomirabilota bacterium]|nr:hypothetical protein [Methylomirabilota bacterium]